MKICARCNIDKSLNEFYRGDSYCKQCRLELNREKGKEYKFNKELIKLLKAIDYDFYMELVDKHKQIYGGE